MQYVSGDILIKIDLNKEIQIIEVIRDNRTSLFQYEVKSLFPDLRSCITIHTTLKEYRKLTEFERVLYL